MTSRQRQLTACNGLSIWLEDVIENCVSIRHSCVHSSIAITRINVAQHDIMIYDASAGIKSSASLAQPQATSLLSRQHGTALWWGLVSFPMGGECCLLYVICLWISWLTAWLQDDREWQNFRHDVISWHHIWFILTHFSVDVISYLEVTTYSTWLTHACHSTQVCIPTCILVPAS
jgi:hypothetical protein